MCAVSSLVTSSLVGVVLQLAADLDQLRSLQGVLFSQTSAEANATATVPYTGAPSSSQDSASLSGDDVERLVLSLLRDGRVSKAVVWPFLIDDGSSLHVQAQLQAFLAKAGSDVASIATAGDAVLQQSNFARSLASASAMGQIRTRAGQLVYRLLCNEQMNFFSTASKCGRPLLCRIHLPLCRLLRRFGEHEASFLRHIACMSSAVRSCLYVLAVRTSRRALRERLIRHLVHVVDAKVCLLCMRPIMSCAGAPGSQRR